MRETLIESEFADVVDIHINTLDLSPGIEPDHVENCTGLSPYDWNCNYLTDRANLCAQKKSPQWFWFTNCIMTNSLRSDPLNPMAAGTELDGRMRGNPRANISTFDWQLDTCALAMTEMNTTEQIDDFKSCVYGEEGNALRAENLKLTKKIYAQLDMEPEVVWALVNGKLVTDPSVEGMGNSRANWQRKLGSAVCEAYSGPKLLSACQALQV